VEIRTPRWCWRALDAPSRERFLKVEGEREDVSVHEPSRCDWTNSFHVVVRLRLIVRSGVRTRAHPKPHPGWHSAVAREFASSLATTSTSPKQALELLLDWEQASAAGDEHSLGQLEAAVAEVERPRVRPFHPKAWRFESQSFGVAFVGSSDPSHSALGTGIEWNLRVDRDRDSMA
jgi:hypothetical protein